MEPLRLAGYQIQPLTFAISLKMVVIMRPNINFQSIAVPHVLGLEADTLQERGIARRKLRSLCLDAISKQCHVLEWG